MRIKAFIDNEWLAYADYDNRRMLPHIMDGLKITQRKAMYTALDLPKADKPMKVSQFASRAAAETAYHHGEVSMMDTVVKLAQDYPGSNNVPLLEKHGQFGSRLSNAASSPRYIFTKLHPNWDKFFRKVDQEIVVHQYDDDKLIEPKYYIPIIPMVLVNGADGIGNGFRSLILNYEVPTVVKALKEMIKHGAVKTPMVPYVNGFTGTIEKVERQVTFKGKLKIVHSTKVVITELPLGYDNDDYKKLLKKLMDAKFIKDYQNHSTEDKWEWIIDCPRDTTALGIDVLMEKFGLVTRMSENFVGWGTDAKAPLTFDGPENLLTYWYHERLKLYQLSINDQIKKVKAHIIKLHLRISFIKWCLKNDFRKLTRAEFINNVVTDIKRLTPEMAGDFVQTPAYRFTTDEVKKLELDMDNNISILEGLEQLTPLKVMEDNLKTL